MDFPHWFIIEYLYFIVFCTKNGRTAVTEAIWNKELEAAKMLIAAKADINIPGTIYVCYSVQIVQAIPLYMHFLCTQMTLFCPSLSMHKLIYVVKVTR